MNLKQLRISKKLSQEDASKLVKIPLRTYKRIESSGDSDNFKYVNSFNIIKNYKAISSSKVKKINNKKIAIAGIGYVGFSLGVLLSQDNDVTMVDLLKEKVNLVNKKQTPFRDALIEEYLSTKKLNLKAKISSASVYKNKDIIIIATPTNFDDKTNQFDTNSVEKVVSLIEKVNKDALIVIKSTVPIGFTKNIQNKYPTLNIVFSPEFLREGHALYDNLYPSRIIIGVDLYNKKVTEFAYLLETHTRSLTKTIYMLSNEAEAVKLFSNAYLAMRVAYFNELDSYAMSHGLNTENIIKGVSLDNRIGDYYNNPSFGYGGYCLPKDSAQLSSSFVGIANSNLIKAILNSNKTRKEFIAEKIVEKIIEITKNTGKTQPKIGIYRLTMKTNSDNFRSSSSLDILNLLIDKGYDVTVYEPTLNEEIIFEKFVSESDIIITNRMYKELIPFKEKVFTRDIYKRD